MKQHTIQIATTLVLLTTSAAGAQQATIRSIGTGSVQSISSDGSMLAGSLQDCTCAVRWTANSSFDTVCPVAGSVAYGISGNGQVVTGTFTVDGFFHAFRWTAEEGLEDLGCPPGQVNAWGVAASGDGGVIVGVANAGDPAFARAFRWSASKGMQDLGVLPGYNSSRSWAVSADGEVVVGECDASWPLPSASCAFRWTQAKGMECLPALPGSTYSNALAVSADGSVIAGSSGPTQHAVRWTTAGGPQDLGVLPGSQGAYATSISADGSVIVGWSYNSIRSFRWSPVTGMKELLPYLASKGAMVSGWGDLVVWPISGSGTTYAGRGDFQHTNRAFIATGPASCPADLTDDGEINGADLGVLLSQWGPGSFVSADLDNDGRVDGADLGLLLSGWGPCTN